MKKVLTLLKPLFLSPIFIFAAVMFIGRGLQLGLLYFTSLPMGGSIVDRPVATIGVHLIAEGASIAMISVLLGGLYSLLRKYKAARISTIVLATLYLVLSATDDQVVRWMGEKLSLSFLSTYLFSGTNTDANLVLNIAKSGIVSFMAEVAITSLFIFGIIKLLKKGEVSKKFSIGLALGFLCAGIAIFYSSKSWAPLKFKWFRVAPTYVTFFNEIKENLNTNIDEEVLKKGIAFLGGNTNSEFPFYHEEGISNVDEFLKKDLSEKPDIIVLTIESLSGWFGDLRQEASCQRLPHLCALMHQGSYFPYTYSVGYPSTEGMVGMQLGIWSDPSKTLISQGLHLKNKSLPDHLGDLGYYRIVSTGMEPSADNFTPWFSRWFNQIEFDPTISTDVALANRFAELYKNRPKDKPLYFDWLTATMHTPFLVPEDFAPYSEEWDVRYSNAAAYMDSAVGIILSTIEQDPRGKNTIVVLTGDHPTPNASHHKQVAKYGTIQSGFTWTNLIIAGPSIPQDSVIITPKSHVDLAPTLLKKLGVSTSNNFVGHDLFAEKMYPTFSFRKNFAAYRNGSEIYYTNFSDNTFCIRLQQATEAPKTAESLFLDFKIEPEAGKCSKDIKDSLNAAALAWQHLLRKNLLSK